MELTRRQILLGAGVAVSSAAAPAERSAVLLFTKIFDRMSSPELARTVKDIGFDGLDLTVRRNGHVDPQKAELLLPEVTRIVQDAGLAIPMITTDLTAASDPTARPILATAHKLGIRYFKTGDRDYDQSPLFGQIAEIQRDILDLAGLARRQQMVMGIHNHSGRHWGQSVWDIKEALDRLPRDPCGYYLDPAHATVEGGLSGWQVTLEMALTRLRMLAVKDFVWEKQGDKWNIVWVPLGQGMVRWQEIMLAVVKSGFSGPISLAIEYKSPDTVASIRRDFAKLQALLATARQA